MEIKEARPHSSLQGIIHRYLYFDMPKKQGESIPIMPTGYLYLSKSLATPANAQIDGQLKPLPSLFVGGQVSRSSIELIPKGRLVHFGIEFHVNGFYKLFGISPKPAYNGFLDFRKLIENDVLIDQLDQAFDSAEGFEEGCKRLNESLLNLLPQLHHCENVDKAVLHIKDQNGKVDLGKLARECHQSPRQFRRRFKWICGIPPQAYCKIIQLNRVIEAIKENEKQSLLDIAFECGYFDTAHFINKFNQMIGQNPTAFLQSDDQLVKTYLQLD